MQTKYLKNWIHSFFKKIFIDPSVNTHGMMRYADNTFCSFIITFEIEDEAGYVAVHPQMQPAQNGLKLKGDFFLYCVFPRLGSCYFVIQQDEDHNWFADDLPDFVGPEFLKMIGDRIVDDFITQTGKQNFSEY